jgi:hypothetical protein
MNTNNCPITIQLFDLDEVWQSQTSPASTNNSAKNAQKCLKNMQTSLNGRPVYGTGDCPVIKSGTSRAARSLPATAAHKRKYSS